MNFNTFIKSEAGKAFKLSEVWVATRGRLTALSVYRRACELGLPDEGRQAWKAFEDARAAERATA